jgi:hypothetical protein
MSFAQHSCRFVLVALAASLAACTESAYAPAGPTMDVRLGKSTSGPTVTATSPAQSALDTTLDVQISGSGFDSGSQAEFLLNGVAIPGVTTNSTRFVSSTSLIANVTIAKDAVPDKYDVAVTTTSGKKGIGTELFTVLAMQVKVDPDSRARYVIANQVDLGGSIVPSGIVGDGRLRDGSSSAGGDSEYQGDMCGVAGTITNGPREAGDLVYDPDSGPTAPCGAGRFYIFNLDGVPTQTAPLSRVFGIWSLAVGASVTQAQGFGVQLANCSVLSFDSEYGGDNLVITRLDNGSGPRQWQVKSQGGHLAACVNLSRKGAASYVATGKKYYLPFAITVTEIPSV